MEEDKITIVTAFFPINRENWNVFERSNNKYIEYFKHWARLKNDLIIYTDSKYVNEIKKIRDDFGRNNTKIVAVDNWREIDIQLYNSIKKAVENEMAIKFRLQPKNPESWNSDYNYIMLLKQWCIKDAINKKIAKGMIAWLDFGFDHGGEYYTNPEEFNQEWKFSFSNKIHIFLVNELDELPIFEICRRMNTYIQGCIQIAPDYLWIELWNLLKKNMLILNRCGLSDDDQTILLMAYRERPEIFEIHESKIWFSGLNQYSNLKLTTKNYKNENKKNIKLKIHNILNKIKYNYFIFKYCLRWYKILKDDEMKG